MEPKKKKNVIATQQPIVPINLCCCSLFLIGLNGATEAGSNKKLGSLVSVSGL